ncbi:FG-GAP repeat domain-containing protein, partial [Stenotrophomonas sp. SrG]|uniref:FG-GAP repeat domain-containing protein n=1 Tax=Stenotrophomonas sp. SrG TaxID=3414430 RepID=UPI003CEE30D1
DAELHALDAAVLDVDCDGDLVVAVAVENGANRLFLNDGTGKLSHTPGACGTIAGANEHGREADFNGDGPLDVVFVAEE